jgi:hypothetical protein
MRRFRSLPHRRKASAAPFAIISMHLKFGHLFGFYPPSVVKRKWWNWQTHHLEGVAPKRRGGSNPPFRTIQQSPGT